MSDPQDKIIIDLTNNSLNEYVYSQFSNQVNVLLQGLFQAGIDIPLAIRGTQVQVDSFFDSLKALIAQRLWSTSAPLKSPSAALKRKPACAGRSRIKC